MSRKFFYSFLSILIALVWLGNGLFCKILNFVPRHQEIVGSILGDSYSRTLTVLIGIGEIILGLVVLTKYKPKLLAVTQIFLVVTMNIMEFLLVPDLLLWGKFNSLFALGFVLLIYYQEFVLGKKIR